MNDDSRGEEGVSTIARTAMGLTADAAPDPELDSALRLLEQSPDCIKFICPNGMVRFINVAGTCLLEIADPSVIQGQQWVNLWPEESRTALLQSLTDAESGKVGRFAGFCATAKGTPKWWDVVVSAFRDLRGTTKWYLAISRDVTGAKLFEQRMQQSEQRFRALADNMAQLAWMAAPDGSVFWYNQRWFDYTGKNIDEMAGWGWKAVHHPSHVDAVVAKFKEHIASGKDWEDTFPLLGADGIFRWFLSRARPLRDDAGRIQLWCGTNTDITEQRAASARLRQKARLIELSHEAILVWDLDGGIVSWNRGCEELYGFDRSEALGKRSHDLLQTRHSVSVEEFEKQIIASGSWAGELCHIAKDGSLVWVDSRQEALVVEGRRLVLETNRDATGKRKSSEIRDILIGELNHRVKNTLAIVQSIASQTARRARDLRQFNGDFNDRLQSLSAAQNVLTEANWEGADLRELVVSQLAEPTGPDGAIRLDGPVVTIGAQTAMHLSLVLHELASNARKHGALSTPYGRVSVDWKILPDPPGKLCLSWQETGGPVVTSPVVRGFGSTLIERMGNQPHLHAVSTFEPTGVVCRIMADVQLKPATNPAYFQPGRLTKAPGGPVASGSGVLERGGALRVLVIEDEPLIAMDIEGMLGEAGLAAVGPAATVAAAIEFIGTQPFDVALVDGNLHGSPVDQIVAELLAKSKPFVFVTGFTKEGLPPGFEHVPVVKKPVQAETLVAAVREVMRARTAERELARQDGVQSP